MTEEFSPEYYLNKLKQDIKFDKDVKHEFLTEMEGEELILDPDNFAKKPVFFVKQNKNCDITFPPQINAVKIMIEGCCDCTFTIRCPIKTAVVEIWNCTNVTANFYTEVGTLQVDLSSNVTLAYEHKKWLGSIVQAGVEDLSVKFMDSEEANFQSGLSLLREIEEEFDERMDQFITRWIDREILTEKIIRPEDKGYPTTKREMEQRNQKSKEEQNIEKLADLMEKGYDFGLSEKQLASKSKEVREAEKEQSKLEAQANLKKHKGNRLVFKQKFEEAIQAYTEGLEIYETSVLYSNRAACYLQIEKYEQALNDAEKCIELDGSFSKGFFRKGMALKGLNRLDEAKEAFKAAYDMEPKNEEYVNALKEVSDN